MTRGRWIALIAAVALALVGARAVAALVVEGRWFAAFGPGAADVWRARLVDLAALRVLGGTAAALFLFAHLAGVARSVDAFVLPRRLGGLEIGETVPGRRLLGVAAALALGLGAMLSLVLDDWVAVDALRTGIRYDEIEPYTQRDLAFFVHWLPVENGAYAFSLLVLVLAAALVVFLYALTPGLRYEQGRVRTTRHVRRHLSVLGALLLVLLAWGHRLDAYALLLEGSGPGGARTALDELVAVPTRMWLGVLTLAAALVVLRSGWAGKLRTAFWTVSAVLALTFVARPLVPALAGRVLAPDRLRARDAALARTRALVTQRAYGVDAIALARDDFGWPDVAALDGRVATWDPIALARAVEPIRRSGASAEVGYRPSDGTIAAVVLERPPVTAGVSPRGEPTVRATPGNEEWTATEIDAVGAGPDGAPRPLDPRAATLAEAGVVRPLLVYPDAAGDAILADAERGVVGDAVREWPVRLAHALARRDLRLAFSAGLDALPAPKIVRRRDVRARVAALVPFLAQGESIAPAVVADSVWWTLPLYTATDAYPGSQRLAVGGTPRAALRHAATALVNAQSGAVLVVPTGAPDAEMRHWLRRFPRLFTSTDRIPPALAAAVPAPTDAVLVQAWALARYGSRRGVIPADLHLPGGDGADSLLGVTPRAPLLLAPPPGARGDSARPRDARLAVTVPLLAGDRVAGALVAVGGLTPTTLWRGVGADSVAWATVRGALGPPPDSARVDVGDGTRGDGSIARGRIRAVPVAGGLAWVEPLYAVARDGVPTLAAVHVLPPRDTIGAAVLRGPTLAAATRPPGAPLLAERAGPGELTRARALYASLREALRRGDFAAFGRALDALGASLGASLGAPSTRREGAGARRAGLPVGAAPADAPLLSAPR